MVEVNFHTDDLSIIIDWFNLLFASGKPQRIKFKPKDAEIRLMKKACFMAQQMIDDHKEEHGFFDDDE